MEHYIVSARKYRPSTFNTVIGQKPLTAALKHAVATDRLAHAYLFCGSRGVGKTSCARIFAKTINCQHRTADGEACNECESCQAFNNGSSLNIIELDAASHNGVDDIKSLNEQVLVPPTQGRYRVFIIDEVHMLTAAAFNAFLKTLEEPPEYVVFILATTEKHKIIPTILSRCQIYDFNRITIQDMVEHLTNVANNEGITTEPAALNVIARKADGAMRDALSIFDQVAASTMGNVTYQNTINNLNILDSTYYSRLVEAFLSNDVPAALLVYKEVREKGFDSQFFINGLGLYLRDLMVAMNPSTITLLEASDDVRQQMTEIASKCAPQFIYLAMDLCNDADLNFRTATNKQFLVELTLVRLCQITAPKTMPASQPTQLKPVTPSQPTQPAPAPQAQQPAQPAYNGYQRPPAAAPAPQPQNTAQAQQWASQQRQTAPQQTAFTPPVHPKPQTVHRTSSALPSFSINKADTGEKAADEKAADSDQPAPAPKRNNEYSQQQLLECWTEYINQHPTEHILINTMRAAKPKQVAADRYMIEVDDAIQVTAVNESKNELLNYIHNKLGNDFFDFDIAIKQGEASPLTWTERQVVQYMAEKHANIRDLIAEFSLTL